MTHIDISVDHVHPLEIGPILMALVSALLHAFCQSNDCWTALLPDHLKLGNNAFFFKFWLSTCQNASLVDGSGPWAAMNSRRDEKPWKNVNWIFQYLVLLTAMANIHEWEVKFLYNCWRATYRHEIGIDVVWPILFIDFNQLDSRMVVR